MIKYVGWSKDVGDLFEIVCDGCDTREEMEGDFEDCVEFLNDNNWQSVKEGEDWNNFCPECKSKEKK